MTTQIEEMFRQAGCDGQLCVQSLKGDLEAVVHADQPVAQASVFKVQVALEAETAFADGRLDPTQRVILPASVRTAGPSGFSLYQDDVAVTLRDLVVPMLTISDNVATDVLLDRVGIDAVNATAARLKLTGTQVVSDVRTMLDAIGRSAGFGGWAELTAWDSQPHSQADDDEIGRRSRAMLTPEHTNRTTPRDMARLLRLIWTDEAGPAAACARVRQVMGHQLTRNRLAAAFRPHALVAAKSGSLLGLIRNEIGVISYPDGRAYAAAVYTQGHRPGEDETAIDAAIGSAAAAAVRSLIQAA